jgi:hypothetical protein
MTCGSRHVIRNGISRSFGFHGLRADLENLGRADKSMACPAGPRCRHDGRPVGAVVYSAIGLFSSRVKANASNGDTRHVRRPQRERRRTAHGSGAARGMVFRARGRCGMQQSIEQRNIQGATIKAQNKGIPKHSHTRTLDRSTRSLTRPQSVVQPTRYRRC